ncbi:helix-turn-helix transcriptional regulator [Ralstonia pickettii]|nr:helix-turn-helix transcriptional regulator [Ralstonia pickettii]
MDQVELAFLSGLTKCALSEYERGRVLPRVDKVIAIAKILDCSTDFLCGLEN